MAHACRLAGSDEGHRSTSTRILNGEKRLDEYHFLNLPGGFWTADDLGSAKAGANDRHAKIKGSGEPPPGPVSPVHLRGKLILGVCTAYQLMVKSASFPPSTASTFKQNGDSSPSTTRDVSRTLGLAYG